MNGAAAVCVTLNAAIDRTYYADSLQIGAVNRVHRVISQAGGKGNNVARAIHRLGGNVIATGFVGGRNGEFIRSELDREDIPQAFCEVEGGESRVCLSYMNTTDQTVTEIIEPGIHVTPHDIERFNKQLAELAQQAMFVVFSGSLPPGCSADAFLRLIQTAQDGGAQVLVDTSGDALTASLASHPFCIKPNEHEVGALMIDSDAPDLTSGDRVGAIAAKVQQLHNTGVALPIVTLGGNGAIAFDGSVVHRVAVPKVSVVNTVGSGDSFVGGLVYGFMHGYEPAAALALATAAGAANAMQDTAAMIDRDTVFRLVHEVNVTTSS